MNFQPYASSIVSAPVVSPLSEMRNDLSEVKVRGGQIQQHLRRTESSPGMRSGKLGAGSVAVETHNIGDGVTTLCGTSH